MSDVTIFNLQYNFFSIFPLWLTSYTITKLFLYFNFLLQIHSSTAQDTDFFAGTCLFSLLAHKPSIILTDCFPKGRASAGAYSSSPTTFGQETGYTFTLHTYINLTCICVRCGRKLAVPGENPHKHEENMQTAHRKAPSRPVYLNPGPFSCEATTTPQCHTTQIIIKCIFKVFQKARMNH